MSKADKTAKKLLNQLDDRAAGGPSADRMALIEAADRLLRRLGHTPNVEDLLAVAEFLSGE